MITRFSSAYTILPRIWSFAIIFLPVSAYSADLTAEFDKRHENCIEAIAKDADTAYENAMIWRDEGGGRRAKHCEAMALFAVGQKEEAAFRLAWHYVSPILTCVSPVPAHMLCWAGMITLKLT